MKKIDIYISNFSKLMKLVKLYTHVCILYIIIKNNHAYIFLRRMEYFNFLKFEKFHFYTSYVGNVIARDRVSGASRWHARDSTFQSHSVSRRRTLRHVSA